MRKILVLVILLSLSQDILAQHKLPKLKEGDLIFQDLDCGPLCDAIEAVTEGYQGRDFSHVGMVVKINDELRVVEAIGSKVQSNSIDSFFMRTPQPQKYLAMRVIPEYENRIPKACKYAISTIGKPYDDRFIMNNDSLYCSELVFHAFESKNESIFQLQPMTYKDPNTRDFFKAWTEYYKGLQSFIPEGLPGINPGLISRSPYLVVIPNE